MAGAGAGDPRPAGARPDAAARRQRLGRGAIHLTYIIYYLLFVFNFNLREEWGAARRRWLGRGATHSDA